MKNLLDVIPMGVCTDSYKAGHYAMYPDALMMSAYGEFRQPFENDKEDNRFVFFGIKYIVENFLCKKWTADDIVDAEAFYKTHNAGNTPYPFPRELFEKFVTENDGYFPVKVQALPEGTCAHIHVPVYQISAEGEYSKLVTFIETVMTHIWYPCNVATLSRRVRDVIESAFEESVDDEFSWLINYKLHDFGFRGCATFEQSVIGGSAHLLNFKGSDTMSACYYAQFVLNKGKPIGESIPATEHSVMTAWKTEQDAIENMIKKFGDGLFACVLDSYDYEHCLAKVLPAIKEKKEAKKGHFVMRPDSGDPKESVLMGLHYGEKCWGTIENKKGFKIINNASVIQGDGVDYSTIKIILRAVMDEGYSAADVTFGMGAGLVQKHNRDTMGFATKLSYIKYEDGTSRDIMKYPKRDGGKSSLPGMFKVIRNELGIPIIYHVEDECPTGGEDLLKTVYNCGPVEGAFSETFDELRDRVASEWTKLPKLYNPISESLKERIAEWVIAKKVEITSL